MKWQLAVVKPSDGTWCWLTRGDGEIFVGKADAMSVGGWCNDDTWEDFDNSVFYFWIIEFPTEVPPKLVNEQS